MNGMEDRGDNYMTESALEASPLPSRLHHLAELSKDELNDRLDEVEGELSERENYRGWRSLGDHQIEQRLASEADWIEAVLVGGRDV